MEHTIANKGKFLKISIIVSVLVFSVAFFANQMMKGSTKSKAADSCLAGKTCTNTDTDCGPDGHCALGIDGVKDIGRCLCKTADSGVPESGYTRSMPPVRGECPQLRMPTIMVEGCRYQELTQVEKDNCVVPQLICDEGRVCQNDGICGMNQKCVQPPMPLCPEGMACPQVMPVKICQTQNIIEVCPMYDLMAPPEGCRYDGNYPSYNGCPGAPKLVCNEGRICTNDKICGDGQVCKNNCPAGAQCLTNAETCQTVSSIITPEPTKTVWWFDNNTQICQEKDYSPMPHMYFGLREFKTKDECVKELQKTFQIICPQTMGMKEIPGCTLRDSIDVDARGCPYPPQLVCEEGRNCFNDSICGVNQYCAEQKECPIAGDGPCSLTKICKGGSPPPRWCDMAGVIAPPPDGCKYEYSGTTDEVGCPLPPKLVCDIACQKPAAPPEGCFYQQIQTLQGEKDCPKFSLICDEGRVCDRDGICGEGKKCYQEIYKCGGDKKCLGVAPKTCRSTTNFCPTLMPPAPWCKVIEEGGVDINGCKLPPKVECDKPADIADADNDAKVCLTDYIWLQSAFNGGYNNENSDKKLNADFNKNGIIDEGDMKLFKEQYDKNKCGQNFSD